MRRDVVGAADRGDGGTGWKRGKSEDLSFTHETVFCTSHARTALGTSNHALLNAVVTIESVEVPGGVRGCHARKHRPQVG